MAGRSGQQRYSYSNGNVAEDAFDRSRSYVLGDDYAYCIRNCLQRSLLERSQLELEEVGFTYSQPRCVCFVERKPIAMWRRLYWRVTRGPTASFNLKLLVGTRPVYRSSCLLSSFLPFVPQSSGRKSRSSPNKIKGCLCS